MHLTVQTLPGLLPEKGVIQLSSVADLTVVGTHHRGVLGRLLAGSVSQSVLQHAPGPIAVVPTAVPRVLLTQAATRDVWFRWATGRRAVAG